MKKIALGVAAAIAVTQIAGCQSTITREESGAVMGAVVGGVVGNQIGGGKGKSLATALGIIAGAMAGSSIGRTMTKVDEMHAQRALETSRTGYTTTWDNPDTGAQYAFEPTRTYQTASGSYCREYQTTVTVGGKQEQGYGTACRQPDGSWQIVK